MTTQDEATERIAILLQAKDKDLARAIDRSNKLLAKFEKQAGRSATRSGQAIERGLARMGGSLKTFAAGAVAGVIGTSLAEVVTKSRDVVRGIAEIGDQAKRSGVNVEDFQEWKYVAEQNRIGIDQMVDGLKELNLRADEFIMTGKGPAAEAFERLGFTGTQLAEALKNPSELLVDIIARLGKMDRAAQIRVADEVFGGSAGERFVELISQGEAGLRHTIQRAHEVGAVMDSEMIRKADELDRKFNDLATSAANIGKRLAVGVASGVTAALDSLSVLEDLAPGAMADQAASLTGNPDVAGVLARDGAAAAAAARQVDILAAARERLADEAAATAHELTAVVEVLDQIGEVETANQLDDLIDLMTQIATEAATGKGESEALRDRLREAGGAAETALDNISAIDGISLDSAKKAVAGLLGLLRQAATAAAEIESLVPADDVTIGPSARRGARSGRQYASRLAVTRSPRPRSAPTSIDAFDTGSGGGGGGQSFSDEVRRIRERTQALEAEAAALALVAASGGKYATSIEYARKKAELLTAAQREGKKITPELERQIDDLARAYAEAANSAELANDHLERVHENAQAGADAMTELFMGIMDGADGAKAALANLLMQIARVQAQKAFSSASGGGFFGWLGGLLSGQAPLSVSKGAAMALPAADLSVPVSLPKQDMTFSGGDLMPSLTHEARATAQQMSGGVRGALSGLDISIGFDGSSGDMFAAIRDETGREIARAIADNNRHVTPAIIHQTLKNPRIK